MNNSSETYMHRCLQLAKIGKGKVAPNPMVGAVLVYEDRIIGEGYHQEYGKAHAEVNCINDVREEDKQFIPQSTLYVSLEPCAHYGKTPPCANLIIECKIPYVVIGCTDLFAEVNGKGIKMLKEAGIEVSVGILEKECLDLNKRFFTFHQHKRPYIVLKWAQTINNLVAGNGEERLMITNEMTNRLVHCWRSEEAAILVGSNTVIKDNPKLNNRLWSGKQPVRLVLDRELKINGNYHVLDGSQPTVVFNNSRSHQQDSLQYIQLNNEESVLKQILNYCYKNNIQSILVEGGTKLLQLFIDHDCWDEARVITNTELFVAGGLQSPQLSKATITHTEKISSDLIHYFRPLR